MKKILFVALICRTFRLFLDLAFEFVLKRRGNTEEYVDIPRDCRKKGFIKYEQKGKICRLIIRLVITICEVPFYKRFDLMTSLINNVIPDLSRGEYWTLIEYFFSGVWVCKFRRY